MGSNEYIRGTRDYQSLVEVIATLNNKRERSKNDIETLKKIKEDALQNPIEFVHNLVEKKLDRFPTFQEIPIVPTINFDMYRKGSERVVIQTPIKKEESNETVLELKAKKEQEKKIRKKKKREAPQILRLNGDTVQLVEENPLEGDIIRGRRFTKEKSQTFNILWTDEEQQRLEELLNIYPDETVSSHRWKKIAAALGNRTPKQVASRTQKYFIKLAKEGKPIPGRTPNVEHYANKPPRKKKKKDGVEVVDVYRPNKKRELDRSYYNPPEVYMSDDEDDITALKLEHMDDELKDTEDYKELMQLLQLKQQSEQKLNERVVNKEIVESVDTSHTDPYYLEYNHQWVSKEPNYLDPSYMAT
eukprot:TRINITY_DN9744_c0_g1_i2.p2 TRINITY_DN9744_c0_g1~~TRINITY_DN9744_c0_g1_i2.p2  ORF type:complete len:359 (-),score=109.97 TRINITY_DN9744_c0_g1_i2:44-1120(-)